MLLRTEIFRGPVVNRGFLRSRSQVIKNYWVDWCSPSTDCNQSAGQLYEGFAVPLLSWLWVYVGWLVFCALCLSENLSWVCLRFFIWPVLIHFVPTPHPIQWLRVHLWFLGPVLLSVNHFQSYFFKVMNTKFTMLRPVVPCVCDTYDSDGQIKRQVREKICFFSF